MVAMEEEEVDGETVEEGGPETVPAPVGIPVSCLEEGRGCFCPFILVCGGRNNELLLFGANVVFGAGACVSSFDIITPVDDINPGPFEGGIPEFACA